ncbi:MAG: peptidoglycan-binding domain-containing protein [Pseudomonadota bacterium]
MTSINRRDFIRQHSNQDLDLQKLRDNPAARRALEEAGSSVDDIARADFNRDGKISGDNELDVLFDRVDRLDTDGNANTAISVDRAGQATPAGKVVNTLGLLFENRPQRSIKDLQGSVGVDGRNNADDVRAVQQRLKDLGFDVSVDGQWGRGTQTAVRVFDSMINGHDAVSSAQDTVRPGSALHKALSSDKAPRWERMPASGTGFTNIDRDGYSYGSNRMADVIRDAGQRYQTSYGANHSSAANIGTNDVSRKEGGANRDHDSHQAGLDLDVSLPNTSGEHGSKVGWRNYDREASYHMVKAFAEDPRVDRVILTDTRLIQWAKDTNQAWADKIVTGGSVHNNHMHIDVSGTGYPAD